MIRERAGHTWQPTALVNELYLELVDIRALEARDGDSAAERAAFFGLAAHLMRRLLIHHARPAAKRAERVEMPELAGNDSGFEALAEVEQALARLGEIDPRLRSVVEGKVFEGLSIEEIAQRLGCGTATVQRQWKFARVWLAKEFGEASQ